MVLHALISSNANVPSDTERKLPYSISHPKRYVHTFKITPPDGWDFPEGEHSRKLPALNYTYTISSVAGKARVSFEYFTRSDRVLPEDFAAYREAMKLSKTIFTTTSPAPSSSPRVEVR